MGVVEMLSRAALLAVLLLAISVDSAKLKVKVFIRGQPEKWGQKIVVPATWQDFVAKSRERLELPVDRFPVIRFYDNEDFEIQNNEEMDNNQHVFIDTSGQDVPPPLKQEQRHIFPNPILAQQMGLPPPPPQPGYPIPQGQSGGAAAQQPPAQQQQQQMQPPAQQQQQQQQPPQQQMGGIPQNTQQQFGTVNAGGAAGGAAPGADRGALLVSLPVQVLDNGKLRVEQVELYQNDDAEDVARVFCINHRIGDPECAKLLEALVQRRTAAVGNNQQPGRV